MATTLDAGHAGAHEALDLVKTATGSSLGETAASGCPWFDATNVARPAGRGEQAGADIGADPTAVRAGSTGPGSVRPGGRRPASAAPNCG
jgi:hypothetical protein